VALSHALKSSGTRAVRPNAAFTGIAAEPLAKSANASAGLTSVPFGAALPSPRPYPSHVTPSSAWHADANRSRSDWQAAGQPEALAAAQLYGDASAFDWLSTATPGYATVWM
jgi:hypothetical protein